MTGICAFRPFVGPPSKGKKGSFAGERTTPDLGGGVKFRPSSLGTHARAPVCLRPLVKCDLNCARALTPA